MTELKTHYCKSCEKLRIENARLKNNINTMGVVKATFSATMKRIEELENEIKWLKAMEAKTKKE